MFLIKYIITGIIFREIIFINYFSFFRITSSIPLRRWYLKFFKRQQKRITLLKLRMKWLKNWVKIILNNTESYINSKSI